jgi:hypothetical protein
MTAIESSIIIHFMHRSTVPIIITVCSAMLSDRMNNSIAHIRYVVGRMDDAKVSEASSTFQDCFHLQHGRNTLGSTKVSFTRKK